jgi:hypothetical protein
MLRRAFVDGATAATLHALGVGGAAGVVALAAVLVVDAHVGTRAVAVLLLVVTAALAMHAAAFSVVHRDAVIGLKRGVARLDDVPLAVRPQRRS